MTTRKITFLLAAPIWVDERRRLADGLCIETPRKEIPHQSAHAYFQKHNLMRRVRMLDTKNGINDLTEELRQGKTFVVAALPPSVSYKLPFEVFRSRKKAMSVGVRAQLGGLALGNRFLDVEYALVGSELREKLGFSERYAGELMLVRAGDETGLCGCSKDVSGFKVQTTTLRRGLHGDLRLAAKSIEQFRRNRQRPKNGQELSLLIGAELSAGSDTLRLCALNDEVRDDFQDARVVELPPDVLLDCFPKMNHSNLYQISEVSLTSVRDIVLNRKIPVNADENYLMSLVCGDLTAKAEMKL